MAVRADVQEEFISARSAHEHYGVVLADDLTVDHAATERARNALRPRKRKARGEGMRGHGR
jgi:hypothetical protein